MKIAELTEAQDKWGVLDQHVFSQCKKYLEAVRSSGFWLLHGGKVTKENTWLQTQARLPRDSDLAASQAFDQILQQLGCQALRLNSIFTTTSFTRAQDYATQAKGSVYLIFPDDNCHFSWTNKQDLTLRVYTLPLNDKKVQQWKQQYGDPDADDDDDEVPFEIASYHEMNPNAPSLASMVDINKFQERFKPGCDNLSQMITAMSRGYEIYVQGKWLAVNVEMPGLNRALQQRGLPPIQTVADFSKTRDKDR